MIDTINPMNLDITKTIHGHVRVELRDRWTGRVVDSQEKDNLVTNALQKLVAAQAWTSAHNYDADTMFIDVLPLWSVALGGLLLFNGTLTESATNVHFPQNVSVVGLAGQGADASSSVMGSLNTQESVYTSTGFTTTWDFLTSQANGTISSLARTSQRIVSHIDLATAGNFARDAGSLDVPLSSIAYLGYDEANKYLYLSLLTSQTVGSVTYPTSNIYRVTADFDSVSLRSSSLPPIRQWTLVKSLTSADGSATASDFVYDKYDNNFVYASDTTLHIVATNGTHTTKTLAGTSGLLTVTENYYWRTPNTNQIYCIDKSNVSDVRTIEVTNRKSLRPLENDVVVATGYYTAGSTFSSESQLIGPSGVLFAPPISGIAPSVRIYRSVGPFWSAGATLTLPAYYLGTIANLDSPVTKTSSQTMKITYTLTEA